MNAPTRRSFGKLGVTSLALVLLSSAVPRIAAADKDRETVAAGKELFARQWLPGDRRSHAGDGLGPLFNGRSCTTCHHLGGIGGAGPKHTNVTLVNASLEQSGVGFLGWLVGAKPKPPAQPDRAKLAEIHPAFRTANSFTLHRFATDKEFSKWKRELFGEQQFPVEVPDPDDLHPLASALSTFGSFPVSRTVGTSNVLLFPSERNAPSLFGVGPIDRIPDRVFEDIAAAQARAARNRSSVITPSAARADTPLPVSGRVSRLKNGRVGRFGWKGQMATLEEFTLHACANELGLEVPGFPQPVLPWKTGYRAPGLDLTASQCDALVKFVSSLPRPLSRPAETEQHATEIAAGKKLFDKVGCAVCHQAKVGEVEGIYSDLLLHDMGQTLSDTGIYGQSTRPGEIAGDRVEPLPVLGGSDSDARQTKPPKFGAASREWRTPPLWGCRDSAPYLHDGRADTLIAAVTLHGGEALESAKKFFNLTLRERRQIESFLLTL